MVRKHGIRYEVDGNGNTHQIAGARHRRSRHNKRCPPNEVRIMTRKNRAGGVERRGGKQVKT